MPQTRFVLKKALEFGHAVVVVVNKIDRPSARPDDVVNATFELFIELNATDEQVILLFFSWDSCVCLLLLHEPFKTNFFMSPLTQV
jgi:predicted membrane GTPase involved in stress response